MRRSNAMIVTPTQFIDQRCCPLARVRVRLLEDFEEATVRYWAERTAIGHRFLERGQQGGVGMRCVAGGLCVSNADPELEIQVDGSSSLQARCQFDLPVSAVLSQIDFRTSQMGIN